ncbi:MAG: hypothetical protein V4640_05070 [Verrucomicrobiota bacterium]
MKTTLLKLLVVAFACGQAAGQAGGSYTNFIRQVNSLPTVEWDMSVAASGNQQESALPVLIGGSRFELWTVLNTPLTNYLLDARTVGAHMPKAEIVIRSEDPYSEIPRTRADRPFFVDVTASGLLSGATDPESAKSVTLLRHVQSYGSTGNGRDLDRTQATLLSQGLITTNATQTLTYELNTIPGDNRAKVRGEERFSVFGQVSEGQPQSQIASRYVQIWPVADGSISGIAANEVVRFKAPDLTVALNDLYPTSNTYTQLYPGAAKLGVAGTRIPEASVVSTDTTPVNAVLSIKNYDELLSADGVWTIEVITETPFGVERLAHVSFKVDRTMELNGQFTTME